jgi:hypothetical protein
MLRPFHHCHLNSQVSLARRDHSKCRLLNQVQRIQDSSKTKTLERQPELDRLR